MPNADDPLADLPPEARAYVEKFQEARSRVALALMLNYPSRPSESQGRADLLRDLKVVSDFTRALDLIHCESAPSAPVQRPR